MRQVPKVLLNELRRYVVPKSSQQIYFKFIGIRMKIGGLHGDFKKIHRGVEQLVAHRAHNPEVVGSNPTPATT